MECAAVGDVDRGTLHIILAGGDETSLSISEEACEHLPAAQQAASKLPLPSDVSAYDSPLEATAAIIAEISSSTEALAVSGTPGPEVLVQILTTGC